MTQNSRKLLGIVATLVMLVVYCILATMVFDLLLTEASPIVIIIYFAVVGTAWCFPAMVIIRWMAKPDKA